MKRECEWCGEYVNVGPGEICPACGEYLGEIDLDTRLTDGFDLLDAAEQDDYEGEE